MNLSRRITGFVSAAGLAATGLLYPVAAPVGAATFTYSDSNCASFTVQDSGNGNFTLSCGTTNNPPPAGAPTGCNVTATTSPSPLTSAGGSVSLSASCTGGGTANSWTWTKNGSAFGSNASSVQDSLPANTGTSQAGTTYGVTICADQSCANPITRTVYVPAQSAGGGTGGGAQSCAGYDKTIWIDMPWANTSASSSPKTRDMGNFGPNDAVVVKITIPANANLSKSPNVAIAEYGDAPTYRHAVFSQSACDFSGGTNVMVATTISWFMKPANANPLPSYYPSIAPGQTYYVNLRNRDRSGNLTCTGTHCDVLVNLQNIQ